MLNISVGIYWKFCWGFFIPISLLGIFIYFLVSYEPLTYQGELYPVSAEYAGYILTILAVVQVPLWFLHSLCAGENKGCQGSFRPNSDWGPAKHSVKMEWITKDFDKLTEL